MYHTPGPVAACTAETASTAAGMLAMNCDATATVGWQVVVTASAMCATAFMLQS